MGEKRSYKYLHLIRHGNYQGERGLDNYGELTQLGVNQSRHLSDYLKDFPIQQIISSNMPRAVATASLVQEQFPRIEISTTELLREGLPYLSWRERWARNIKRKKITQHRRRMDSAFSEYFFGEELDQDVHLALVSHGNIIRYLICRTLGLSIKKWNDLVIHQCSVSTVRIGPKGEKKLQSFGEAGFLPPPFRTLI